MTLCPGRLLAPKELAALRAVGKVGLSPTAPLILAQTSQAEVAVLGWATDALVLPDNRINCVLYSLAALLATSWSTLAPPGEPLLQHAPKLVKYKDVIGMVSRARQRSYPLGALSLPRCGFASWEWVATARAGTFMFVGLLLRGGCFHRHSVGLNAGASLLYVGPEVVVLDACDRKHPALLQARIEHEFGLFIAPGATCRQLVIDPRYPAASALPLAHALPPSAAPSKAQKRRLKADVAAAARGEAPPKKHRSGRAGRRGR